jgi:hypothetical protein
MALLVTVAVSAAAIAIGELCLSLPASRIPRAEALVEEALTDFARREEERELKEHIRLFQLERALAGAGFGPRDYLTTRGDRIAAVKADLNEVREALANGQPAQFKEIETKVFFYLVEQARKGRKKS